MSTKTLQIASLPQLSSMVLVAISIISLTFLRTTTPIVVYLHTTFSYLN